MFDKIANPKSDLISQSTERRTIFPPLVLRECSQKHPMIMFAAVVAAAFVWALIPGETTTSPAFVASAPARAIKEPSTTTGKTSRLPMSRVDHACEGQSWGGEAVECLKMIARDSGRTNLRIRLIADAPPANSNTPNIF
jgi:hypothetical protein